MVLTELSNRSKVLWKPFAKQLRFLECPTLEALYGGGAGGGKSASLLIAALTGCVYEGWSALLLRRQGVDLEKSGGLVQESHRLYKGRGYYDGNKKRWRFRNNSFIEFGHCKNMKDLDDYYSAQYTFVGIDQAEQFLEDMYLFFFSRVRTTNPAIKCKVRLTCNPVGVGKEWLNRRFWVSGENARPANFPYEVEETIRMPDGSDKKFSYHRAFIPSLVFDNPYIMENDPQYLMRLQLLPEKKRLALMRGDWNAFEGSFFTEWDRGVHVCEPFDIPFHWKRSISFDWGFSDPTAIGWFAENPATGQIFLYREMKLQSTIDVDVARLIGERSKDEEISCVFYPWDLDFKNPQTGISMKERMQEIWNSMGLHYYLKVANKDRKNGWSAVRHMLSLRREDRKPRMQIFNTCKYVIESFPLQIHDENDGEDLDTNGDDHGMDMIRYFAVTYRGFYEKPVINADADPALMAKMGRERPIDVGAAMRMPNGEFRWKKEENVSFRWSEDY